MRRVSIFLSFVFLLFSSCSNKQCKWCVETIQCNYKENPKGIVSAPAFSWIISSNLQNQKQSAYQLLIADNLKSLESGEGNIYKSEKVFTEQSIGTTPEYLPLTSATKYYWKVKCWNQDDIASEWSKTGTFITAILKDQDWDNAQWISYETMDTSLILVPGIPTWGHNTKGIATRRPVIPLFRKEFQAEKEIKSAYLFISGLGHYKAYINGSQISTDIMTPGWTNYHKTCSYNTYDVTQQMQQGENAIGIIVGTGFYNINNERYRKMLITYGMPKTIAKLQVNYSDGTTESIVTNDDWKASPSPITYSSIYGGENYDARLEQKDWNKASFDDSGWQNALLAKHPGGELKPEVIYPVKRIETFTPKKVIKKGLDTFAFDFGQNAAAIIEIQLKGQKGDTVRIYPSELLFEELKENQRWTGWPHYYEYILKGDSVETWSPMFTYYGMRYAHVTGAQPTQYRTDNSKPEIISIKMHHISNSSPQNGSFWCSNKMFNQIDTIIRYAIKSNMQTVLTDCPHRERLGWIEQTYLMGNSVKFNYDVYHMYVKLVGDMIDSQRESGLIGNMAPEFIVFGDAFTDSPEWGSAVIQVPWLMYKWYGDISLMQKAWSGMQDYLAYLDSKATNNIINYGLGDWYDLGPKAPGFAQLSPIATTATSVYYLDYKVMAQMAEVLGKNSEADIYKNKAEEIRKAYNNLLFHEDKAIYASGSQTAMAIPLSMGIVDDKYREQVLNNLIDTLNANDNALTAGDIGFHYLIDALTEGDYSQLVYDMNNRDDVPGYGYQLKKGATAMTESWEALESKSNNHFMLGHIMEWFYTGLGGIRQTENSVAYKEIIIKPTLIESLEELKTSHKTPYGTIISEWKNTDKELQMHVQIPVNTTAEIYIPTLDINEIKESGILIDDIATLKILKKTSTYTKILIGSGDYNFKVIKY